MASTDSSPATPRAGGILVDAGGRPVTDAGGRPVFVNPSDSALVLDDQGTPAVEPVGPTGTTPADPDAEQ